MEMSQSQYYYNWEKCTMEKGDNFWPCNTVKNGIAVQWHIRFHAENIGLVTTCSATECSVISDL